MEMNESIAATVCRQVATPRVLKNQSRACSNFTCIPQSTYLWTCRGKSDSAALIREHNDLTDVSNPLV